jgi:hypothetical protein
MTSKFSSTSIETTLQSAITTSGATSMTVATGTGTALMGGVTLAAGNVDVFTVAIDVDTINEEIVFITNQTSDTMTIVRGRAGTSPTTHTAGATVKHVLTSYDLTNFQAAVSPVASLAFSGSTSGTTTVQATAVAGTNTLTLPATNSDTLVGKATTDTLTNKTLTAPIISTITNTGTLTLPTSTDTLVGRATTDTLTNKTLTTPKISIGYSAKTAAYTLASGDEGYLFSMNNAATQQFNIPTDATFNFAIGTVINFVWITGAGQPTIGATTPGTTTVISTGATSATPKLRAVNSAASAIKLAANSWLVVGDLA